MKVWKATEEQVLESAAEVGLTIRGNDIEQRGRALSFRLGLGEDRERYRSIKRRRIDAVCWHGHRDFMRALYRRAPDARILSAVADWRNASDFEQRHEETGDRNVGSLYAPLAATEACGCDS